MRRGRLVAAAALCVAGSGCGGGGTPGVEGAPAGSLTGMLELADHSPTADALQVPPHDPIELRFDAPVVFECLADDDTWLQDTNRSELVPGTFETADGGRTVRFHPQGGLRAATEYEFQLSPLTCDVAGRILDRAVRFGFRSLDSAPPTVAAASIAPAATGVSRSDPFRFTFSEAVDPGSVDEGSVLLTDLYGNAAASDLVVTGPEVQVIPVAELAGSRDYVLMARGGPGGVRDVAGNALAEDRSIPFTTAADTLPPAALSVWPPSGPPVSPRIHPAVTFDDSMDPYSVEPVSLLFLDEFGSLVPFRVHASRDQRTLRVEPLVQLVPGRDYTLAFRSGAGAVTDVSGNALAAPVFVTFGVGADERPPALTSIYPESGTQSVPVSVQVSLAFDETLDGTSIRADTVTLLGPRGPVPALLEHVQGNRVLLTPDQDLAPGTDYRVRVRGGHDGVRDPAGNTLPNDVDLDFTTGTDVTALAVTIQPRNGNGGVPLGARLSAVFDSPLDPASVDASTVQVSDQAGRQIFGVIALEQDGRVVSFRPSGGWQAGDSYQAILLGGPDGLREVTGNWLRADSRSSFTAAFESDTVAPNVQVWLNGTTGTHSTGLVLPPFGFAIDVEAQDPRHYSTDYGSVSVRITGPGAAPDPVEVFSAASIDRTGFSYLLPAEHALEPGEYTLVVEVADLSGNVGASAPLQFRVVDPHADFLPFERTQVVWVRTDLDRDGNGSSDFADDMLRLGFATPGDPIGTNDYVADVVRKGILARANALFHRSALGDALGPDSVPLRLSERQPAGLHHMQMALGGADPTGRGGRVYGDPSTGVLGRALFDYRNSNIGEKNTSNSPALGVFPAEMFFFQAELHRQVYPGFLTLFGQRFLNLCPPMGGVPAGSHPEDPVVLSPAFDYDNATTGQRARFHQVFEAADDWASVIGVVLAHEIGHSVGLVAPGPSPRGLHGDSSLHNEFSTAAEVMASAVGYESMVTLDYRFRDLNLAYLRQRVLLQ